MRFGIGQSVPRTEDPRLLRGKGRFIDDFNLPHQAFAFFLRAPHAHADIRRIDTTAAVTLPGVLAVLTGADYADDGIGDMGGASPRRRRDGSPMYRPPRPALTADRVRFAGQIVAMVVAETAEQAKDAAEAIAVDYVELPIVTSTATANQPGASVIWPDCADNECFVYEVGDGPKVDQALADAPHVIKQSFVINRISANTIEPRGALGHYDSGLDHYTIYTGHQRPFAWRTNLAKSVFKIAENQLTLISGDVGGSFGMKGSIYPEIALVCWASKRVGRPVKWTGERSECLAADDHARDNVSEAELGLSEDGEFLALRVRTNANLGAYVSFLGFAPPTASIGGLAGVYTTPAVHVTVAGVFTNTSSTSPYRGAGRPEASYIIESMIDLAARKLNIDPVMLRRRNLIAREAMPYKTPLTFTYDSGDFAALMDEALEKADYAGFESRHALSAGQGKLRGIGVSFAIEQAAAPQTETAEMRFDPTGSLTVLVGTTPHGQGHETIYKQLICERLGLQPQQIRVIEGDTDKVSFGTGTGGSRSATIGTSAVFDAVTKVESKCRSIAAHHLEAAEPDIELQDGEFRIRGTDRCMSLSDTVRAAFDPAQLPPGMEPGLYETATFNPTKANFPNGCHICEVEIDQGTGAVAMARYAVVYDVGVELNPLLVHGQIRGGVVQGAGQALMEDIKYDAESGQLLSGSFMDYAMPRAEDMCAIVCSSHPVPTATNPLGVKGAGECGTVGALPAVMNAINDALARRGIGAIDMPATPERVWKAMTGSASSGAT